MQFVFSRAFARSVLFASLIVVLLAKTAHAGAAPANAVPDYLPPPIIFTSWTRSMAHALDFENNIVRYAGGGHGIATNNNQCIDAITKDYFIRLQLPPEGTVCPARFGAEGIGRATDVVDEARWDWSSAVRAR